MTEAAFDSVRAVFNDSLLVVDEQNEQDAALKLTGKIPFKQASTASRRRFTDPTRKEGVRMALLSTSNESTKSSMKAATDVVSAAESRNATITFDGPIMQTPPPGFADTRVAMEALRIVSNEVYGVAGRAFIEQLATTAFQDPEALAKRIRDLMNGFRGKAKVPKGTSNRVIDMFALTYAAGLIAKNWGILPVKCDRVTESVLDVLAKVARLKATPTETKESRSALVRIEAVLRENAANVQDLGSAERPNPGSSSKSTFGYIRKTKTGLTRCYIPIKSLKSAFPKDCQSLLKDLKTDGLLISEGGTQPKLSIKAPAFIPYASRVYCIDLL